MRDGREVAVFTKSRVWLAVLVSHSVAAKFVYVFITLFVAICRKGDFFMKKFFPKLSVKDICVLGLLIAITIVLAVYCTFRVGEAIKIPMKFISIFIPAVIYGPFYGELVATLGDLFNCLLAPSGALLPQITLIEFLNGFVFGIFFFRQNISSRSYLLRTVACVLVLFGVDMVLTTAVLSLWVGIFPSFGVAFATRIVAGVIKAALHFIVIFALKGYLGRIRRLKK